MNEPHRAETLGNPRWANKPLADCLEKVSVPTKIPRTSFLDEGAFPIVSQEADFINGYWNNEADLVRVPEPIVIFGDHTQVLKLVDFDFVVGADGVKILKPKVFLNAEFLKFYLEANPFPSLGYARHYRHISTLHVPLPPLEEQKRIVAVLDQAFAALDRARANAEANLADSDRLFRAGLETILTRYLGDAISSRLGAVCEFENGDRGKNYPGRKAFVSEGVPFINAGHLDSGIIAWDAMNYIPEDRYEKISKGKVKKGDVLFCLRGSLGKFGRVDRAGPGAIASSLVIVRAGPNIKADYLCMYFKSNGCGQMISRYAGGAAQPNLSAADLKNFELALPEVEDQLEAIKMYRVLSTATANLQKKYVNKLADLASLRQSLLQKAYAGELT